MTHDFLASPPPPAPARPIVWSIAGTDSGGGAGLSADQRAADACHVHLCPVVAAVTAQNSQAVTHIHPVPPEVLDAQLAALFEDMPPAAIKTGLLGSAENVAVLAHWIDRLRARDPRVALVIDPVLRASTGAALADDALLRAYVTELLPRASLITPNAAEAARLAAALGPDVPASLPALARVLRAAGAQAVAITGGDSPLADGLSLDWADTPHASGWLALPRVATPHGHGTGCTFATSAAAALARGFVAADALVLAKMATTAALCHGWAAGHGAGPVGAHAGFAAEPALMPCMSWDESYDFNSYKSPPDARKWPFSPPHHSPALYAITDNALHLRQAVQAGVRLVQLRIKTPAAPDAAWHTALRQAMAQALADCRAAGATLVVNDHWRLAAELAAGQPAGLAIHLGQEDLLALGPAGRAALAVSGLPLGISSHSLWELARARSLRPWYVACGPVWPTLTKAMPWLPQGLHNLAWWVRMAGGPVVAIGGILQHEQASAAAQTGAAAVCVVRGLGSTPAHTAPGWQAAIDVGHAATRLPAPAWPQPSLGTPASL
ncbi:MAG: bifunctional hydroxymethylpyrimidine kinase/phosphomethylpyrimidine kinase [Pseudomonadota bacterium]|nr:bifunctional hydroxymethylpyrimidine kinase/phosphomethylpyrimidine kinase [Pseudomonadota bacterium]